MSAFESAPSAGPAASLVLPIFPLPDATLFPHTFMPLHIFEARYRALVTDALARDRLDTLLATDQPPAVIADRAAAAFVPDPRLRQELLETLAVANRLERLSAALETLVDELPNGRGGAG